MTREEAAKLLDILKVFDAPDLTEAIKMAKDALREQEERSNGCEYCDGSGKHFLVDDGFPYGSYNSIRLEDGKAFLDDADGSQIRIKFCPMCGRRLENT